MTEEPREQQPGRFSRRTLLKIGWNAGIATGGAIIGGIADRTILKHGLTVGEKPHDPKYFSPDSNAQRPVMDPEIQKLYPEMKDKAFQHIKAGGFDVYNFNHMKLNPKGFEHLSGLWNSFSGKRIENYEMERHDSDEVTVSGEIKPRNSSKHVMFVVPEGAPHSSYAPDGYKKFSTFTRVELLPDGSEQTTSFVTQPQDDRGSKLGIAIQVETAQSLLDVTVDPESLKDMSEDDKRVVSLKLQEVVCNGIGDAQYFRNIGFNYYNYRLEERKKPFMSFDGSLTDAYILPPEDYQRIDRVDLWEN